MQWEPGPGGGFTTGDPWLPLVDPDVRNVADARADPASLLAFYRGAIALRKEMSGPLHMLDAEIGVLAYTRGRHRVAVNTTASTRRAPWGEEIAPGDGLCDTQRG
jgi:alpha-glucosidase